MSIVKFSVAVRSARALALAGLVDSGGAATLTWYDGTQPATVDTAVTSQNVLAQQVMNATAFSESNGVLTANAIADDAAADATGVPSWYRITNGAGDDVIDGDIGLTGSDASMEVPVLQVTQNVKVETGSLVYTEGNA